MNTHTSTSAFSNATAVDERKVVNFPRASRRLAVSNADCAWRDELSGRLEELIRLPVGWDGYRARPVSFANAIFALSVLEQLYSPLLDPPVIVPGYNGDLQAEWHVGGVDIELHVQGPNEVQAWRQTPALGPDGEEIPLTNDFAVVGGWIGELAGGQNAVAAAGA
jgi:hypothetical protein